MKFQIKRLGFSSGGIKVIVMDDQDAFDMGAKPGDRVRLFSLSPNGKLIEPGLIAIVDIATDSKEIDRKIVGLYDEILETLNINDSTQEIEIFLSSRPKSYDYIRKKVKGQKLSTQEIIQIVQDCNEERLLASELASFITAVEIHGMSDDEIVDFTIAYAKSGDVLDFGSECYDKHSTGGVPGNKVTLIIVPIAAAAGIFIPKTSTRAITSPSGTADSFEVFGKIAFSKEELMKILNKTNAGIFWTGSFNSAPAADVILNVEKKLNVDPLSLMMASIISKKMGMGIKKMVLDVPTGQGTKFPTIIEGRKFAQRFKEIARRVEIDATCLLTSASQPIGHAIGPALEAREALDLLIHPENCPSSLLNKSTDLAGVLLEMAGKAKEGHGKDLATKLIFNGKAYKSMKQIIQNQGGNPEILPRDIKVGPFITEIVAEREGIVASVDNRSVNQIAKIAGCPGAKSAGVEIMQKIGEKIEKGDIILRIYSPTEDALKRAVEYYNSHPVHKLASMTIEII